MNELYTLSASSVQLFIGVGILFAIPIATATAMLTLYKWHTKL